MPIRRDRDPWTPAEDAYITEQIAVHGLPIPAIVRAYPKHFPRRTVVAVRMRKDKLALKTAHNPSIAQHGVKQPDTAPEQQVERKETQDGLEAKSYGRKIKTVADLLKHIDADLTRFEVAQSEATKNEQVVRDDKGKIQTVEYHRVFVRLKPKAGPDVRDAVREMLAEAKRGFTVLKYPRHHGDANTLQAVAIFDPHIGKLAWPAETGGGPWDTPISIDTLRAGVLHLMAEGEKHGVGERAFVIGGDFFHHDGRGMTTSGTVMDYDSRFPKMYRGGTRLLIDLIATSAAKVQTRVYIVPGNHDATLSFALQETLCVKFEGDKRVVVDERFTSTKFFQWGRCLIGLDHGDKGKKRLPGVMSSQCEVEWGTAIVKEFLTGHLHGKAAIQTIDGVVVRTMDSLATPDKYHADEKFNTAPRTIEAFRYHKGGMLAGTDSWSPDLNRAPRRGT